MRHDPKPPGTGTTTVVTPAAPPASPALLPLSSLAEAFGPAAPGSAVDVAALCLELPPLEPAARGGQGAASPPRVAIDGPWLASPGQEPGPPVAANVDAPAALREWAANAPAPPPRAAADDLAGAPAPSPAPPDRVTFAGPTPVEGGPRPELARYELPVAPWPAMLEPDPPGDEPSLATGAGPADAAAALGAPAGRAFDELLARLRDDGLALPEPASLFPGPGPGPWPSPAGGPTTTTPSSRGDLAGTSDEVAGSAWDTFGGPDLPPSDRAGGSTPGREPGPDGLSGEMLGELAARLAGAAERLEQAVLRISHPTPANLAPPPRPFRGRVDG